MAMESFVDFKSKESLQKLPNLLRENGYVILKNSNTNTALLNKLYRKWQAFFDSNEKFEYEFHGDSLDGYFPFKREKGKTKNIFDLKEFYYFYPWGKCPTQLRLITYELYLHLYSLGWETLFILQDALPAKIQQQLSVPFNEMVRASLRPVLRILHYPPFDNNHEEVTAAAASGSMRAAEHEDLTLLTFLPAAIGDGLQIKHPNGEWLEITNNEPSDIILTMGEMLALCTDHFYKATTHRVINPNKPESSDPRYSMAFFLNPSDHIQLTKELTAGQCIKKHLEKRLSINY